MFAALLRRAGKNTRFSVPYCEGVGARAITNFLAYAEFRSLLRIKPAQRALRGYGHHWVAISQERRDLRCGHPLSGGATEGGDGHEGGHARYAV
jgi:hypothetical protein